MWCVAICLMLCFGWCCGQIKEKLYWEVHSGRHFDDIVTSSRNGGYSTIVKRPTFLIFYMDTCYDDMAHLIRASRRYFPGYIYVNVLRYNYRKTDTIWYKFDRKDDLLKRYDATFDDTVCLQTLYLEAGSNVDEYEIVPDGLDLHLFLKYKLFQHVTIRNELNKTVNVRLSDKEGESILGLAVRPTDSQVIPSYTSQIICVYDLHWSFIYGYVVPGKTDVKKDIIINRWAVQRFRLANMHNIDLKGYVNFKDWTSEEESAISSRNDLLDTWLIDLERIYSILPTYPVNLPKMTVSGYRVTSMPDNIVNELVDLGQNVLELEEIIEATEPIVNTMQASNTKSYAVPKDILDKVEPPIRRLAESFCGTSLNLVNSALTSYDPRSIVRDHVEWRDGFVISAMAILGDIDASDLKVNNIEWQIELVESSGERQNITLRPGDFFFYEAKVIIVSRRWQIMSEEPYYVTHLHYTPTKGWPWQFIKNTKGEKLIDKDGKVNKKQASETFTPENEFEAEYGSPRDEF